MSGDKKKLAPEQKAMKQLGRNLIILVVLMVLVFWFIFRDQNVGEILAIAQGADKFYILLGMVLMMGYFSLQAWNVGTLLKSFGEKVTFWQMLKFTLIEFFFCAVTPGATGGQPVEIYYMTKEKISGANATLAIFIQLFSMQFAIVAFGIVCLPFVVTKMNTAVWILYIAGMLINGAALALMWICIVSPKAVEKLADLGLGLLGKINEQKAEELKGKLGKALKEYKKNSKFIRGHKKEFRISILKVMGQVTLFYAVPFCIYRAFGLAGESIFSLFCLQAVLFVATSGLPLPGAIGASESVFLALYGGAFGMELLSSAMLLNRGVTFYWFVVVSLIVVMVTMMKKDNKK